LPWMRSAPSLASAGSYRPQREPHDARAYARGYCHARKTGTAVVEHVNDIAFTNAARFLPEQGRHRHDHSALTISALQHVVIG
jgi:hypothetical protein